MTTMLAAVLHAPGPASALKLEHLAIPHPTPGKILIRIRAFGLNRSELFTRQGHSPSVLLPRVLGIEAVGTVEAAPGNESIFPKGARVATAMGGLGRGFDGGYAQYTLVPAGQVKVLEGVEGMSWEVLGSLPEMLQTSWGALKRGLRLQNGERLLVRGGTTSVGLAAAAIAKKQGCFVGATSRSEGKKEMLVKNGADEVFVDGGEIAGQVASSEGGLYDKVLELVGATTIEDSLKCVKEDGIVCMTGCVGNSWTIKDFSPMESIPVGVCLSVYGGSEKDFMATPWDELVAQVKEGSLKVQIGKTFKLEQIVEAHEFMEANNAGGKIVVLVD